MSKNEQHVNLSCDLDALTATERKRFTELHRQMNAAIVKVDELAEGFELRFNYEQTLFLHLAEYVSLEHLCCPFLRLGLAIDSGNAIRLQLAGTQGVKAFLRAELGL